MTARGSLARRLTVLISVGFAAIWLLAVLATALVLRSEQNEMLDLELRETARVLLPVLTRNYLSGSFYARPEPNIPAVGNDSTDTLIWILADRVGTVLAQSTSVEAIARPTGAAVQGISQTDTHVFYTTALNAEGFAVRFGDPKIERVEAHRESLIAFMIPMLAILPLGYLLVGWISRSALAPLDRLREEISVRDHGRLDPIDAHGQHSELQLITATINGFMIRLSRALDTERAFATNAAHELRTPVAVALAQTQRLRAEAGQNYHDGIDRIEHALQRMSRLVARLLQLARADAGIGLCDAPQDLSALLEVIVQDQPLRFSASKRLSLQGAKGPVLAQIDPDAFGIVAGNLIDNAIQHSSEGSPVEVHLSDSGVLTVCNDGPRLTQAALSRLTQRFSTADIPSQGFGLGLHICDMIVRQAGGHLTLRSPQPGKRDGFQAQVTFPKSASLGDP